MNASTIYNNLRALFPSWNNTSQLAIQQTIANGVGQCLDNTESELTNTINVITGIIQTQRPGDSQYYIDTALYYEPGVSLIKDSNLKWVYASPDDTKKLITQAAITVLTGDTSESITLKVNKTDSTTGLLTNLTTDELTAFKDYFKKFQWIGIPPAILSITPNLLSFTGEVSYLNNYDKSVIDANIQSALSVFRDTFRSDGTLYIDLLQNYIIENVAGVKDFYIHEASIPTVTFENNAAVLPAGCFNYDTVALNYHSVNANI